MMSAEEPQTDREWLMRIDSKVDTLLDCHKDHETRLRAVEGTQMKWIGRDGAIVAGISALFTVAGLIISFRGKI